jgi:hypothetical protein
MLMSRLRERGWRGRVRPGLGPQSLYPTAARASGQSERLERLDETTIVSNIAAEYSIGRKQSTQHH